MSEVAGAINAGGGNENEGQNGGEGTKPNHAGGQNGENGSAAGREAAASFPAWMEGLTDDLRADPDLNRYPTVEALAKGMKETRAWARGRVPIPQDDAGWKEFGEKLRPESPDKYAIEVPEGDSGELAAAYRQFAFDTGVPSRHAEATAAFFNRVQADIVSRTVTRNQDELRALDLELGTHAYTVRLEATRNMLAAAGIDIETSDAMVRALEQSQGAGKTLRGLFRLAERSGELDKVDGTQVALAMGGMAPEAAQAEIDRLSRDRDFMAKNKPGTPERTKWDALNRQAATRK